eukprot:4323053-Prymnesium_polylepis.1
MAAEGLPIGKVSANLSSRESIAVANACSCTGSARISAQSALAPSAGASESSAPRPRPRAPNEWPTCDARCEIVPSNRESRRESRCSCDRPPPPPPH